MSSVPTPAQAALIDSIVEVLHADHRVEAAWLAGSLGRGEGDAFSDVDVLVLVPDGLHAEVTGAYAADLGGMADAVLATPLFGGAVLNVVTADWERFDLSFVRREHLDRYDAGRLKTLFNKGGASPPRRPPAPPYEPPAARVEAMVSEFLRVLGLAAVVLGRQEHVLAVSGIELQRRALIELMTEANRVPPQDRGGALHLRRLLSADQLALLADLPPMRAEPQAFLQANAAIARIYLPLARRLCEETGAAWPQALEDATRRRLQTALGFSF